MVEAASHVDTPTPRVAGVLSNVFMQLYENDVIDEDGFFAWEEDTTDHTPGKEKVLAQAIKFMEYLRQPDEEEEESDSEVAEALKDVVRPSNTTKLR